MAYRATQCTNKDKYKEAELKQNEILQLFRKLAVDIQGSDYHRFGEKLIGSFYATMLILLYDRYARSFSGGFEEFVSIFTIFLYRTYAHPYLD